MSNKSNNEPNDETNVEPNKSAFVKEDNSRLSSKDMAKNVAKDESDVSLDSLDQHWAELAQDWQSQPLVKIDIPALVKQTIRRTIWAKCLLAMDIIATVGITIVFIYGLLKGDWEINVLSYMGVGSALSMLFLYYAIPARLVSWRYANQSPDKAVDAAIISCQSSLKYIRLIKISCFAFFPISNWFVYSVAISRNKPLALALIIVNIFLLITYLVNHYFYRKRSKELIQLQSVKLKQ